MLNPDPRFIQGSPEWLEFRKTKITATDAAAILEMNPWKSRKKLFEEKISPDFKSKTNAAMQRGNDLEPLARDFFSYRTGIRLIDKNDPRNVLIHPEHEWMMASYDGISQCGEVSLEIKCPKINSSDFDLANEGEIPYIYQPQVQHQIAVKNPKIHYYLVFDGFDGIFFEVKRDYAFIEMMIEREKFFHDCLMNKIYLE